MLLSLVNVLGAQSDKIVVSRPLPVGVLGYYSFLQNTIERSRFIRSAVGAATLPHQAAIGSQGDRDKINNVHRMLVDLNMFGLAPVYAAVGLALTHS